MKFTKLVPNLFTNLFLKKKKVLVIVGPTASGKSSLAIEIAKNHNAEVVSCDSRQIYKGLEIFSGAVTPETNGGVKHHLISFVKPGAIYSADLFVKAALPVIDMLHKQDKLPIVVGGTGFWAQALMFEKNFPAVEPDYLFRETLEKYSTQDLFSMLSTKDPRRANIADPHNRKRIVRALEIIETLGTVPVMRDVTRRGYSFMFVYLKPDKDILDVRITKNVSQRIKAGLLGESDKALANLSDTQVEELGLGFKYVRDVKHNKITQGDFLAEMTREEIRYAKRQKTFFNKLYKKHADKKIIISDMSLETRKRLIEDIL